MSELSQASTKVSIRTPSGELFEIECSSESELMTALDACDRISRRAKEERDRLDSQRRWERNKDMALALIIPATLSLIGLIVLVNAIAPHWTRTQGNYAPTKNESSAPF